MFVERGELRKMRTANDQTLDVALPPGADQEEICERSLVSPANAFAGR
jgi:hypothetical protein